MTLRRLTRPGRQPPREVARPAPGRDCAAGPLHQRQESESSALGISARAPERITDVARCGQSADASAKCGLHELDEFKELTEVDPHCFG